jgi:cell division septation protein DedD
MTPDRGRAPSVRLAALLAAGAMVGRIALAAAQTEPRLAHAVRLAQEGLGDSARTEVQRLLDATQSTDTLYPQILYARAVVAASPLEMRRDLQRVTTEYAASTWADRALLRLAQLDYAGNDLEGSARNLERLRLDYPASPIYAQAAFWAGRVYFDLRRPPSACRWLAEGLPRVGSDLELKNRLLFYDQRCAGVALDTARIDSTHTDSAAKVASADSAKPAAAPPPVAAAGNRGARAATESLPPGRKPDSTRVAPAPAVFRIQVAAVNTRAAADSIAKRLKAGGFDSMVAAEKGLFKVRVGSYATRAAAAAALPGVRAKLGAQAFVVGP